MSGVRAKQGMLPPLAHEVRPCLVYGEFSEVDRRAVFKVFDALPLHTVAAAYPGPINATGDNAFL
jgi:hypothetical protein